MNYSVVAASAIEMGFPHSFREGNKYIFGATFDRIDNHRQEGRP